METKSRYEVMKELNDKKENLIREKDGLDAQLKSLKIQLRDQKRELEDAEELVKDFEAEVPGKKKFIDDLIKASEASIASLQGLNSGKN